MAHSRVFDQLRSLLHLTRDAERLGGTLDDARAERARAISRRQILGGAAAAAGLAALAPLRAKAGPIRGQPRIAVVGAGLAGLVCADTLSRRGVACRLYEAHPGRVGGRVLSDRDTFPGQASECGGEMIDTLHTTMLRYARELGLAREDYERAPGEERYFFFGAHHAERDVVEQWRVLVPRLRDDLRTLSGEPTFFSHSREDELLDHTDLASYLGDRAADLPLAREVLLQAYIAEYGLEPHEQSCLNFLQFIHLDRRGHFAEFGQFSDERYHLVGGNDGIARALAARLADFGSPVLPGAALTRLARRASGEFELYLNGASSPEVADAVVLTLPFGALRNVALDASLGLSADKLRAIRELGYGANVKTAVRFDRRVWADQGGNGGAYADLDNVQNTWETNRAGSVGGAGILTDYAGGARGVDLQENPSGNFSCGGCHQGAPTNHVLHPAGRAWINAQVEAFVHDLDRVFPGAAAAVSRRSDGTIVARRSHWTPQGFSRGSYTAYRPGQFTTIAGLEGQAAGALKFAGEHTDSFYDWQGYMEGACNSGVRAAGEVLDDLRNGRL